MKCKLCGRREKKYIKVVSGTICPGCYNSFPDMIRNNIETLTPKQLISLKDIFRKITQEDREREYWGFIDETTFFSDHSICFNDTAIDYIDIADIHLNFHPLKRDKDVPELVHGYSTIVITTKKPKIRIEERIKEEDSEMIRYSIHGRDITYAFEDLWLLPVAEIQKVAAGKRPDLKDYRDVYFKFVRNMNTQPYFEDYEKERENAYKWSNEHHGYTDATNKKKTQTSKKKQKNTSKQEEKNLSEFEKATMLFKLSIPYSEKQLKERRNELIKNVHPDAGGSTEDAAIINEYYDILKKFVV